MEFVEQEIKRLETINQILILIRDNRKMLKESGMEIEVFHYGKKLKYP